MTVSRAHRRGPSPSLAQDIHAPSPPVAHDVPAAAHSVNAADDRAPAGTARPAEAAMIPVSAPTPVSPAIPATHVIPVSEAHLLRTTVPAHPSRAAGVRAILAEHLTHLRLPPECRDNAVLATDELFANAVKHGSPDRANMITVTIEYTARELRVTVADSSSALPCPRTTDGAEESGRGLAIVAALADDWGTAPPDPGGSGKKVWFALVLQGMP
ncbi:ATP-binding protein [Streptomyces sp. NBC_00996]|uniref:ATP-binding protein n=1 Tax=Streptomyces sp. NBC_00996 TaxID=2903710 RepID=UPI00386B151D|nr:ATP-binding protein [Streptomyces sp. NBC_00996]